MLLTGRVFALIITISQLLLIGGNGETCSAGEGLAAILTSGKCLHNIRQRGKCQDIGNGDSSSNGYGGTRGGNNMYPPGCWIDTDKNKYYYNAYLSSSATCKSRYQCVCDTKTCQSCPQGYYSAGGTDVLCTKYPSDKRITGDGKSTTTGHSIKWKNVTAPFVHSEEVLLYTLVRM
jgi:hypothetical protein